MEKNPIYIKVLGKSASGKSTIAKIIYDALVEHGFPIDYSPEFPYDTQDIDKKVGALQEKNSEIKIIENSIYTNVNGGKTSKYKEVNIDLPDFNCEEKSIRPINRPRKHRKHINRFNNDSKK